MSTLRNAAAFTILALAAHSTLADEARDTQMKTLAAKSGCLTCHHVEQGSNGPNGLAPIGPNWQDVANKYQGQANASNILVSRVMQGTSPYNSHWQGKVSGLAMPPNAVAINQTDAKQLVDWILALNKKTQ